MNEYQQGEKRSSNPPAFPRPVSTDEHINPCYVAFDQDGMTLRDYFAAQALGALIGVYCNTGEETPSDDYLAHWAYRKADAMLAAREDDSA